MHITKIELEDIKSHAYFTHDFQRGTTAITGENGAGKTTIIEAVAWTLFDLLDYKKDDFVRRGAKKGVARVTFESGLDERQYSVYRDTGTGYYVYDPQLKMRIAEKKEEVARFLWQHLGVEAGTDLESLFRRAIGVPQGTFTAIFLETATERKKAFDKLLKVEEYRQGAEKLRETARFIEQKTTEIKIRIGRAEGELARFEQIETEHKTHETEAKELTTTLENLDREVAEKSANVKKYEEIEARVSALKLALDNLQIEKTRADVLLTQKQNELALAQTAWGKIKLVREDYEKHIAAAARLKELERERSEREKLNAEKQKVETAQINVLADRKKIQENLENALNAHLAIEKLKPKLAEQTELEKQIEHLRNALANAKAKANTIKSLDDKIVRLRENYKNNQTQIKDAEARSATAKDYETLQKRDTEITRTVTGMRAKLEHDEQFQAEVRNGICPILSQKCLNLKPGETLESFLKSQFTEIKTQIGSLEIEQKSLADALRISREAEKHSAALATLKNREAEIKEEGTRLKAEKDELEKDAVDASKAQSDLSEIESKLKVLDNPKAKISMLETEAKREMQFREKLSEIEKNL